MAGAEDVKAENSFSDGADALGTKVAKLDLEIAGIGFKEHSVATSLEGHWLRCGPLVDHSHGHQSDPGVGKGGGRKGMMILAKDCRWRSVILVSGNGDYYLECFGGVPSYLRAQILRPLERAVGVDAHLERVPVCRAPVSRFAGG